MTLLTFVPTVTLTDALVFLADAVTVATPFVIPLSFPVLLTVTVFLLLLFHFKEAILAFNWKDSPFLTVSVPVGTFVILTFFDAASAVTWFVMFS